MKSLITAILLIVAFASIARAQAQPPATAPAAPPATRPSAQDLLNSMLRPSTAPARPLEPLPDAGGGVDATSGANAVAPRAATQPLLKEGSVIIDRVGRLTPPKDPQQNWEFTFDSDSKTMADPPLIIMPGSELARMQSAVANNAADLKFRVSGEVTVYN